MGFDLFIDVFGIRLSGVCGIHIMEAWICLYIILVSNQMEVYIMEALICLFIESVCGFVIDLCLELGVILF